MLQLTWPSVAALLRGFAAERQSLIWNDLSSSGTFAVAVQHHGFVARYCEIRGVATGIGRGSIVKGGDVIAFVGKMFIDSMLHFETYTQPYGTGGLTNRKNQPFQRRADLQNPTSLLDRLTHDLASTNSVAAR